MNIDNKRVTLIGLGRSTVAAAQLLLRHGAHPFISEVGSSRALEPWKKQCEQLGIPCEMGGHSGDACEKADMIVLSPGVPLTVPLVAQARLRGIPVLGEFELAWRFCSSKAIAVTGTNGKTTVTTLLRDMIASCGYSVALAGNNDTPLSLVALEEEPPDWVVLEVSSYQLETVEQFHPAIACILNVTPDHLSRHGSIEHYAIVKGRIFMRQQAGDTAIRNADDPLVNTLPSPDGIRQFYFSMKGPAANTFYADDDNIYFGDQAVASSADNPLPGKHNLANVLAALAVMHAGKFPRQETLEGLRRFKGVEHRIEHVMSFQGVDYYNDSKSTNLDSLRVALESFSQPIILLAGGRGKGSDYASLCPLVRKQVKHLIAFGEDAALISAAYDGCVSNEQAASMMDAVKRARLAADSGDVILLSPACASFDMYDNFESRGRDYKDCLRRLPCEETRGEGSNS
ncbi:MAG: UDP-N-acetylmuramoyl-L-alanine--D-glutamate ligase [Candidatus Hydrogenedentes bacterium]|nr:UDP-N-acetylmuramoyl-L-alanine--D-glutamate ligase [Candidatus Hydrogenedentota bacterium]